MYIICNQQINFYDLHHKIRYRSPENPLIDINYFAISRAIQIPITSIGR